MRFFLSGTFRSGTFRSGTFHSGSFRPGSFRPDAFPPRHFLSRHFLSRHFLSRHFLSRRFLSRRFPPRHFSAPAFCFAAALLSRVFAAPRGDVRQREKALVRVGDRSVVMGRDGARWGRQGARPGGRLPARPGVWLSARQGREGRWVGRKSGSDRCGTVRPVGEGTRLPGLPCVVHFRRKGCLRSRIGGPNDTNRIKNTRFGLPFNEKFGMFVHMNRIRLAEVTLIGHATGSLSGPCAGRGTGGENIWCFMSPAR